MLGMVLLVSFSSCATPIKNSKTASFKVAGNCNMCKENIENAANRKGIVKATWDVDSKMLELTYNSVKTTTNEVLKRIAYAGYDNEQFLAPDEAYAKLEKCCQYDRMKKSAATVESGGVSTQTDPKHDTVQIEINQMKEVYMNYFLVKDALIKDDGSNAAVKSKALLDAISKVDMTKLSKDEHAVWMKNLSALKLDAEHISETKDVAHQREHFASLSKSMIDVMKAIKPEETVYVQHCPMYDDGKGADWLSKENAVKNPYYGKSMLTCGKTTETIK